MTATESEQETRLDEIERRLALVARAQREIQHSLAAIVRLLGLNDAPGLIPRRFRILSQNEEDGITYALLRTLGPPLGRFVEIGAGTNGGNSGFLATELSFEGLMVDASEEDLAALRRRIPEGKVNFVSTWVTTENVDELVRENGFDGEIDLLSIDIDGNDYWVWEALTACAPRIVIVEYNSLFGRDRSVTVPYDPEFARPSRGTYYGASLQALVHLGKSKGYRLVAVEPRGVNAFFLRAELAPEIPECDPRDAYRVNRSHRRLFEKGFDVFQEAEPRGLVEVG